MRSIAKQEGVDITTLEGSGIHGRVTKKDILAHLAQRQPAPAAAAAPRAAAPSGKLDTGFHVSAYPPSENVAIEPMSKIRQITAAHMRYSKDTAAHVTTVFHIDMSKVHAARERAKARFAKDDGTKLTYMPFIFKATCAALKAHPKLNAAIDGTNVVFKKDINLGMAVALDWGLIVPVIKHADQLNLLGLAKAANDLADRARAKKLEPEEVQGGTFTITNPGVFGSLFGTPIINQPQVAILGIGAMEKRPVVMRTPTATTRSRSADGVLRHHLRPPPGGRRRRRSLHEPRQEVAHRGHLERIGPVSLSPGAYDSRMPEAVISSAVCPECEGRGWVVEEDGRSGAARPCECQNAAASAPARGGGSAAALPGCRLANFNVNVKGAKEQLVRARALAARYVERFLGPDGRLRETGLVFIGPPGAGKTHLAVGVLHELVERYAVAGAFVDFTSLIHQIQLTFDPQSQESKAGGARAGRPGRAPGARRARVRRSRRPGSPTSCIWCSTRATPRGVCRPCSPPIAACSASLRQAFARPRRRQRRRCRDPLRRAHSRSAALAPLRDGAAGDHRDRSTFAKRC